MISTLSKRLKLLPSVPAPWLLATPVLMLLILFFVMPMIFLIRVSFYAGGGNSGFGLGSSGFYEPGTWSLDAYQFLLTDQYFYDIWGFTVGLGVALTLLVILLAYPLSLVIHRLSFPFKGVALAAVVLPKLANSLVIIYGLQLLLGKQGLVNQILLALGMIQEPLTLFHNLVGVLIGGTYSILPYAVLILVTGLDRIDTNLLPAAQGLGATPWQAFWRVTFPLSLPSVILAALLSLIFALGLLEAPSLLGSPQEITLPVDIRKQAYQNLNWPRGAAEALMMLITVGVCVLLYQFSTSLLGRKH